MCDVPNAMIISSVMVKDLPICTPQCAQRRNVPGDLPAPRAVGIDESGPSVGTLGPPTTAGPEEKFTAVYMTYGRAGTSLLFGSHDYGGCSSC
jgi:hypothetical protein